MILKLQSREPRDCLGSCRTARRAARQPRGQHCNSSKVRTSAAINDFYSWLSLFLPCPGDIRATHRSVVRRAGVVVALQAGAGAPRVSGSAGPAQGLGSRSHAVLACSAPPPTRPNTGSPRRCCCRINPRRGSRLLILLKPKLFDYSNALLTDRNLPPLKYINILIYFPFFVRYNFLI